MLVPKSTLKILLVYKMKHYQTKCSSLSLFIRKNSSPKYSTFNREKPTSPMMPQIRKDVRLDSSHDCL